MVCTAFRRTIRNNSRRTTNPQPTTTSKRINPNRTCVEDRGACLNEISAHVNYAPETCALTKTPVATKTSFWGIGTGRMQLFVHIIFCGASWHPPYKQQWGCVLLFSYPPKQSRKLYIWQRSSKSAHVQPPNRVIKKKQKLR